MRLVGFGGGVGGCLAWGGTGGGFSKSVEEAVVLGERGRVSFIRETVLGGLEIRTSTEDEDEVEEEEDEADGVGLLADSRGKPAGNLGGSRACLGGGGSCWESCIV